jgi:hypothetical protein
MYRKINIEFSPSLKINLKLCLDFHIYSPTTIVYRKVQHLICTKTLYFQCSNLKLISSKCSRFCCCCCCFLAWQHICNAWWMWISKYFPYVYGYQLFSSSRRLVSMFVRGRLNARPSQEKRKDASSIFYALNLIFTLLLKYNHCDQHIVLS